MTKDRHTIAFKPTVETRLDAVAKEFLLDKIRIALPNLRKLGTRPHNKEKDEKLEEYEVSKSIFCTSFYAQRLSKREIMFILDLLEQKSVIKKKGTSSIRILTSEVWTNPESLMRFFDEC